MPFPLPDGLFLVPCPQHPKAAEPCCLSCGHRDARTAAGGLYCLDCLEDGVGAVKREETNR